jgi:hypothetical protein
MSQNQKPAQCLDLATDFFLSIFFIRGRDIHRGSSSKGERRGKSLTHDMWWSVTC